MPFGVIPHQNLATAAETAAAGGGGEEEANEEDTEAVLEHRKYSSCLTSRPITRRTGPTQCLRDDIFEACEFFTNLQIFSF